MHNNSTICFKICTICIVLLHKKIATTVRLLLFIRQGMRESNPHQKFWRLLSYHLTNPLDYKKRHKAFGCTFKTTHKLLNIISSFLFLSPLWLCPRPISNSQLRTLLHFHLCPIYLVVFKGSYYLRRDISS